MSDLQKTTSETTAVDDVRLVRDKIARESGGNMIEHVKETNRIGEELRAKLNVKLVPVPQGSKRDGTRG